MTVKELRALLAQYDENMTVEFADSYWRGEGYGDKDISNASTPIGLIREYQGRLILEEDECY